MAQDKLKKAAKQLAARNSAIITRTHLISLGINALFILLRFLLFRSTATRSTFLLYAILSFPAFLIEFWFERIGRPTFAPNGELKRPGEDLEAKGLTEYLWDVLYWTWGCIGIASVLGNKAWWMWTAIPLYSAWLAYTTFGGMRQGLAGMTGAGDQPPAGGSGGSNRQRKMEKRGGQRTQYR
ncbi:hypothetical protein MMC16_003774 [Acarospora aff. strigata]|nr:hypothetical protein [Acarospora aff. strigata]